MGAAGLKVRKEEGMRVRGTIQFSQRDTRLVHGRGAGGAVAGPPGVVVRHGRLDVGASTGSNRDAGQRGDYRFVHRRRACLGKPMGNELPGESSQRAERLSVRSAIGRAVGGRRAAETGERTRPLRVEALIHPRGTS